MPNTARNNSGLPTSLPSTTPAVPADRRLCRICFETECIYAIIQTIFVIGFVADVMVMVRVLVDRKLRSVTFVAVGCLSFSDAMLLLMNIVTVFDRLSQMTFCTTGLGLTHDRYWIMLQGVVWFSAESHISLISLVRLTILTYPLRYKTWLTTRRTVYSSAFLWAIGLAIFGVVEIIQVNTGFLLHSNVLFVVALWLIVYGVPVIVTGISHIVKLHMVKRNHTVLPMESPSDRQMLMMILAVIILSVTLPIPRLISNILEMENHSYPSTSFAKHFKEIAYTLYLLNFAVNPFIYAFLSRAFRRSIKKMCARGKRSKRIISVLFDK